MSDIKPLLHALVTRVLDGEGYTSFAQRRAAFDNTGLDDPLSGIIEKVAKRAVTVSDADITAACASGLSEDQIYELVVCAALGQAKRQYDVALAALAAANGKE